MTTRRALQVKAGIAFHTPHGPKFRLHGATKATWRGRCGITTRRSGPDIAESYLSDLNDDRQTEGVGIVIVVLVPTRCDPMPGQQFEPGDLRAARSLAPRAAIR